MVMLCTAFARFEIYTWKLYDKRQVTDSAQRNECSKLSPPHSDSTGRSGERRLACNEGQLTLPAWSCLKTAGKLLNY